VKIVNEIRSQSLNSRMNVQRESMDSQHERLLHIGERCLPRGRWVLSLSWAQERNKTVFKRKELSISRISFACNVGKLAHLADIFCHLSKLNTGVLHNYICTTEQDRLSKRNWFFGMAVCRREIQRCLRLQTIFWQV